MAFVAQKEKVRTEQLRKLLQTIDGLKAMLGLLDRVYCEPEVAFWSGNVDHHTVALLESQQFRSV